MTARILLYFLLATFSINAFAAPAPPPMSASRYGRAPYFMTHESWNCRAYKRGTRRLPAYGISFLWRTPGMAFSCLDSELANPRVDFVEMHLMNGSANRLLRSQRYETLRGYTVTSLRNAIRRGDKRLRGRIEADAAQAAAYLLPRIREGVECAINPVLETGLDRATSAKLTAWIRPFFSPRCRFVWNPVGSNPGKPIRGTFYAEAHGARPVFSSHRCIANPDGDRLTGQGLYWYMKRYQSCRMTFAWEPDDNCVDLDALIWQHPRSRTCKKTSDFDYMEREMLEVIED